MENGKSSGQHIASKAAVISFHNLEYVVPVKAGCCKSEEKIIINNVDGIFKPGMNAIMGPTGSGKTSLLDIIAGRKDPSGLKNGQLLIDGNPQPKNFKCMNGYVVQDDVVMGTLTVRENFMFSANVRLPSSVSYKEKVQRVEETLTELGLTHCAETKVGTPFIRGVSGGERKRTNIGMELIISPSVLFLDEPTTGLDASTSYAVLNLLQTLSRKGRTIVFSIHQPRYAIYKLFDNLMLLAKGRTVFHGAASDALDFFSSIGYTCEEHDNPADFFLDVVNGDSTAIKSLTGAPLENSLNQNGTLIGKGNVTTVEVNGFNNAAKPGRDIVVEMREHSNVEESLASRISDQYKKSSWHIDLLRETQPILDDYQSRKAKGETIIIEKGEYQTSFLTQLRHVSGRAIVNLIRNPMASILEVMLMTILGLIVGGLYFDLDDLVEPGIQNRYGLFFFLIMNQIFSNLTALELFINERATFIHENASGFYRVSAYFIAKLMCDLIPMRIIPLVFFVATSYFMTGLVLSAANFFLVFFSMLLTSVAGCAIAFFFGAAIGEFSIANLLCVLTYVIMMIFGGLLVNLKSLWVGIRWLQYLSVFRYGLYSLSIIELKGLELYVLDVNGTKVSAGSTADQFLGQQGIAYETDWDLWQNFMALIIITGFFFVLCYIMLRRIKKYK